MDMLLLGITVVSLIVAFIMSMAAMRLMRDEKQRSSARVAALSLAAAAGDERTPRAAEPPLQDFFKEVPRPAPKAPWAAPKIVPAIAAPPVAQAAAVAPVLPAVPPVPSELPLNQPRIQPEPLSSAEVGISHASGFLGASEVEPESGGRQKTLAFAAAVLFLVLAGGRVLMMSGTRGTTGQAMG